MKGIVIFVVLGVGATLGVVTLPLLQSQLHSRSYQTKVPSPVLEYQVVAHSGSDVHVLKIPAKSGYSIRSFVSNTVATVAEVGAKERAIAVINAGFFDPMNQKTTSHVVSNGQEVVSPQDNERLTKNLKLAPYLSAILNRSEFRGYVCGSQVRYDIVTHQSPIPSGCQLTEAMGGGPQLLPRDTAQQEGFTDIVNGVMVRDAIGSVQPNARTAIGLTPQGGVIWVMVAQTATASSGMTLVALTDFLRQLGAHKALNLDGGTSSSLYYKGQTIYGKRDASGQPMARAVKSMLVLQRSP